MERVVENGKVAVLVSPEYGAGWYSWNEGFEPILFDPMIVEMVRNNRHDEIESYVKRHYKDKDIYCGGAENLVIVWVDLGERFRIDEYDVWETLVLESEAEPEWITA